MQQERNYLIKKVFPDIRRECRRRNVEFTPLDLRWGITEEEASNGRVVEICMEEIERTRPFFIGLVGGRYGWIPKEGESSLDLQRLSARFPRIAPYFESRKSITEMEMLYGVLDNPEPVEAHFFLRNEHSIPKRFREQDMECRGKLSNLRDRIRRSAAEGRCRVSDYTSAVSLGRAVHRHLMEMIDRLYPLEDTPDLYGLYAAEQQRKLDDLRKVYTPCYDFDNPADFSQDQPKHIDLFTGVPGSGLSAIVANQLGSLVDIDDSSHQAQDMDRPAKCEVVHTIVDENIDTQELLKRMFVHTLHARYPEIDIPVPDPKDSNPIPFADIIGRFPVERCLWVIDGVEKLATGSEQTLTQILCHSDRIGRLVLTCSDPEVCRIICQASDIPVVEKEIGLLSPSHILAVTTDYLRHYSKELNARQISAISASRVFTSVKMLRAFLDKLVTFGIFEDVDRFIHSFATLDTSEQFYDRMLQYLEEEHGVDAVREVFVRLQASVAGMSEDGLFKGVIRNPLEQASLLASVEPWTRRSRGNILLASDTSSHAVAARYPLTDRDRRRVAPMIITDCRRSIRSIRQGNKEGWLVNFIFRRLLRGFPGALDDNELMYNSTSFIEILRQYIAVGRKRKVRSMLRHFGIMNIMRSDAVYVKLIPEIRDMISHPARMFDSFDIIMEHYLMDQWHILLIIWSSLFSGHPAGDTIQKDLRRKWLPKSVRSKLYIQAGMDVAKSNRSLDDMLDESNPDNFDISNLKDFSQLSLFILSKESEERVHRLLDRLMKAVENSRNGTFRILYLRSAAFCVARLQLHDQWREVKKSIMKEEGSRLLRNDIEFLDIFDEVTDGKLQWQEAVRRCEELVRWTLSITDTPDSLQLHVLTVISDYWTNKPRLREPQLSDYDTVTDAMRRLAGYVTVDSIYSAAGSAVDAVNLAGLSEMAIPAYRAILERQLTPSTEAYYLIRLAEALGKVSDIQTSNELGTALLNEAFALYDRAAALLIDPAIEQSMDMRTSALDGKMRMAFHHRRFDVGFETAQTLLEVYRRNGYTNSEVSVLNCIANAYAHKVEDCVDGSAEFLTNLRKAVEFAKSAYELKADNCVLWQNYTYDLLQLHAREPQSRAMLRQLLEDGKRFRNNLSLEDAESFAKYYVNLAVELGLEREAGMMIAAYPDVDYFERPTRAYPLLYRADPGQMEDSKYAHRLIKYALRLFSDAHKCGNADEGEAVLRDIVECGQAPKVLKLLQDQDYGSPGCLAIAVALAHITGQDALASELDRKVAHDLAENLCNFDWYIIYYYIRLVIDGTPLFHPTEQYMLPLECREVLVDRITGGGVRERELYLHARSALSNPKDAEITVQQALELEGTECRTLISVARRFRDDIIKSKYDGIYAPLLAFVKELENVAGAGAVFPPELHLLLREAVNELCKLLYSAGKVPDRGCWLTFAVFMRRYDAVLPAYVTLAGIYVLDSDQREELLHTYMTRDNAGEMSDPGVSAIFTAFYWSMRGDGMNDKADRFIDFLLENVDLSDDAWVEMMGEKAFRQRRLGDYKGALDIYRQMGEQGAKIMPAYFEVLTSLLADELVDFEIKLESVSTRGSDLETGLYRAIYCLKVDNHITAEKIRTSLPAIDEKLLSEHEPDEDSSLLRSAETEAMLMALYYIELVRYYRRSGKHVDVRCDALLDEAERLLDYIPGQFLFVHLELASERKEH